MPNQVDLFSGYERKRSWLFFERLAYKRGARFPVGVDEVGRGCLAGPVVAAAVILPPEERIIGIDDSKKLTPEKRRRLYYVITDRALDWSLAMVSPQTIDQINILQASLLAMKMAIEKLFPQPDYILIDGRDAIPQLNIQQMPLVGGDGRCQSIAAASIIAKVCRDRLMAFYAKNYPQYGFEQHKGYATKHHRNMLRKNGPTPLHRKSFAGVL